MENETCTWTQEDYARDIWNAECGEGMCLNEGPPSENNMRFCCFCGKELREIPYGEEKEAD